MKQDEHFIVVAAGGQHYAVRRHAVRGLQWAADRALPGLADLLGYATAHDEEVGLVVADAGCDITFRVHHADLRGDLPQFPLPDWIARQAHPAVAGYILDETELMPLVDLVQLARQIGHDAR